METDSLIQLSLRTHFQSCTILTIAHRLATIMDYDRAMVLDFGEVKEFDTPANLLRKGEKSMGGGSESSIFCGLVNETGPQTSELLKKLAFDAEKAAAQQKQNAGSSAAEELRALENSIWRDPKIMAESSVRRRAPRRPSRLVADGSSPSPIDRAADPDDDLEVSMVKWHENDDDEEGRGEDDSQPGEGGQLANNATGQDCKRVQID
jgi:hypothetical protein